MAIAIAERPISVESLLLTQVVKTASVRSPTLVDFRRTRRSKVAP